MTSRRCFLGAAAGLPAFAAKTSIRSDEIETRVQRRDFKNLYKEDLPTPCMVVDLEIFEKNLRTMADHCRNTGIRLRGHVKVHKSPDIAKRQVALGSIGVTCATIAESELMSHSGIAGVLLTRQVTGKNNINRAIMLAKRDPTFGTVVDDPLAADWLQEAAAREGVKVRTAVDVFAGLTRHGIEAGAPALELARKVDSSKNLKLIGLMGYSGGASHTHGWSERKKKSGNDLAGLMESVALARKAGLPVEIVTGGSTGTYNIDSETKGLTELQAGSFVFMDTLYRQIGGKQDPAVYTDFGPALTVMTTVISKRHPHRCTIDAGNKALLKPTDEVKGRPEVKVENQGAEYGILVWKDSDRDFKLGERVELYPSNLDMSTNVYDRYYVAKGERIVDVWPIMGRAGAAQR
ncbi:MAG TPA: DSD1 family PLP-dependent enzyme [Bryobacteraceae bacterium]|jgi:D-serine deaminase-like pyridoxal phosphate-dependent protein|nr:DSD1 family PLP-dependent enzyme [Bryobacteraceae bacterium]